MPLVDLHELRKFNLVVWRMEKNNDALRRLSWPKLNHLGLLRCLYARSSNRTFISLSSNLRIIADNCLELRILDFEWDIDTIPLAPFDDTSSKKPLPQIGLSGLEGSSPNYSFNISGMSDPNSTSFGFNLPLCEKHKCAG